MIELSESDLRTALHEEAASGAAGRDPWPELRHHIGRRRRRRRSAMLATVLCLIAAAAALTGLAVDGGRSRPSRLSPGTSLIRLASYEQACGVETHVCVPNTPGDIPKGLQRPVRLRTLAAGVACPATTGRDSINGFVYGMQFGQRPVYMIVGNRGDASHGVVVLGTSGVTGWYAMENVFLSVPGYSGPFLVRGARLDGPGSLAFGGSNPVASSFIAPPGPGANSRDGYRFPPDSIWVTKPGCYGFQIDGRSFSETVVIRAQAAGSTDG
jgi:hypothetical protein